MTMETALAVAGTKVAIEEIARSTIVASIARTQEAQATNTPVPTYTPTGEMFIVEEGWCLMMIGDITGNPKDVSGCAVSERKQESIAPGEQITVAWKKSTTDRQIFCTLYRLDGTYIMSNVDTKGSGQAVCRP